MNSRKNLFSRENLNQSSQEELIEEIYKLNVVLDINQLFSSELPPDIVKNIVLLEAARLTEAEYASIFLLNESGDLEFAATTDPNFDQLRKIIIPMGQGVAGHVAKTGEIVNTADIRQDERFYRAVDQATGLVTRSYLCLPLVARNRIIGTIQVINKHSAPHFTRPDERILTAFAGQAAIAIETSILHAQAAERERLERDNLRMSTELDVARRIQTSLLPGAASLPAFDVAATMLPADEVGGDYYDVFQEHNHGWILIGDVSGHGVESGLIMMMTQTLVKSFILSANERTPADVLAHVNRVLRANMARLGAERYMTISAIRFSEDDFVYAGKHQDLLILRDGKVAILPTQGTWLGITDDLILHLENQSAPFRSGDILILFTDGITEAENEAGELFGMDRLVDTLCEHQNKKPSDILSAVLARVSEFQHKQSDDITLLVIKKK